MTLLRVEIQYCMLWVPTFPQSFLQITCSFFNMSGTSQWLLQPSTAPDIGPPCCLGG